jgi:biotin operon repressor
MSNYIRRPTQEQRILKLLRERGDSGVSAKEITDELGILQYNARVFGLRRKGYNIVNDPIGHFTLYETEETKPKHFVFDPITCSAKEV